jgi:conjugal transfer pilus assembly protein TraB
VSDDARRPWVLILLSSKLGRMILLAGALGGILFVLSEGCSRKAKGESKNGPREGENTAGVSKNLPPRPSGFDESLPVAQQYKALISSYGDRVTTTEKDLQAARKELEALRTTLEETRSATHREEERALDPLRTLKEKPGQDGNGDGPKAGRSPFPSKLPEERSPEKPGVRVIELSALPPEPKPSQKSVRIPAATGGMATLMNGVFAPVSGEPSPVRLRFDAALVGPNRSRIPLRDAFLIGKAQGDPNASRVSIQIDKLAYVKESGEAVEAKVLGYVVGEDGLEGVPGTYEWRAWELVPLAVAAGALQGGTDGLAQNQTTTAISPLGGATNFVTGDALKLAGFRAASNSSGKMGEIVSERVREIRPAVSTPADRKVQVVFLDGVTLEGLGIQEVNLERDWNQYRGLDLHR